MSVDVPDFQEFEKMVAAAYQQAGYQVSWPPANQEGYDLIASRKSHGEEKLAVQVKAVKRNINVAQLRKFIDYCESFPARDFTGYAFVSAAGFSLPAIALAQQTDEMDLRLLTLDKQLQLNQVYPGLPPLPQREDKTYIGVFTCKGGVGKTTVAAHLAGAMAMTGYEVALLDLDPQRNLNNLLPDGIYLQKSKGAVNVFNYSEWSPDLDPHSRIVVCDCSPTIEQNPSELISKFNYCIIPTTLNPLGLNKNGHVIISTLKIIRQHNAHAKLFVLINGLIADKSKKVECLKKAYRQQLSSLAKEDANFHFIDPEEECAIRQSNLLYYWGMHLYTGYVAPEGSNLAFEKVGGRCHPAEDFLQLVDYLEERTELRKLKT